MRYWPTIGTTLLILVAVLLPGSKMPSIDVVGIDKIAHFTLFFIWSVAVRYDFTPNFKWFVGWIIGAIFSASTELFQIYADGRSPDVFDVLFDTLGLTVGLMVGAKIIRIIMRLAKR